MIKRKAGKVSKTAANKAALKPFSLKAL